MTNGSTGEATDQGMLAPECSLNRPDFLDQVSFSLALSLVTFCCAHQTA